ncbi:hypothetical protein [Clostridium sp. BSD9I1]|uniref:hypothetical protein n=1 Tax=Clostridium sp. BSD9I1 TaxID=2003589 RepID=UPI0016440A6A|nr:hypothetical protein [Clostridium sp. BSD9I1]
MACVCNGVIEIDDSEVLYNPCIENEGQPMSQEELDAMFEEYKTSIPYDFENPVYQFEKTCKNRRDH